MKAVHENRDQLVQKDSREMVTFCIAEQDFCLDIMTVREIRGWTEATVLPRAPDYVLGVINLRGAVVPIIDLSSRLGLAPLEPGPRHVIVIVMIEQCLSGLLVSSVSDILGVTEEEVQPVPSIGEASASCLTGVISKGQRLLRILDVSAALPKMHRDEDELCPA